jgi:hypothetical protein
MEGKQIVIVDEEGREEALAVYVNWRIPEIERHVRKVFAVHETIRENVYSCEVLRNPVTPEAEFC